MKNTLLRLLTLTVGLLLISPALKASHMAGSDMEYKFTGKDTLVVTLRIYRDCNGIPINATPSLNFRTVGCTTIKTGSVTMTRTYVGPVNFMCTGSTNICMGGTFPFGMEENRYQATVYLQQIFTGGLDSTCCWLSMEYQECCRNGSITNLNQGNFFINAEINRCISPYNSSPKMTNEPVAVVCVGQAFAFNNGALDTVDHDSISFEMGEPLNAYNSPESFQGSFTKDRPLQFLGFPNTSLPFPAGFHFSPITGDLLFTATAIQQPVLAFKITEWRKVNGTYVKIGVTRRDVQFYSYQCPVNNPPEISVNGSKTGPFSYTVCAGNSICLAINGLDKDTASATRDTTQLSWNKGIPWGTFSRVNNPGSRSRREDSASFCWTPTDQYISSLPYYFTVKVQDDRCPVPGVSVKAIGIAVKGVSIYKRDVIKTGTLSYKFKTYRLDPLGAAADSLRWRIAKTPGAYADTNTHTFTTDSVLHTFDTVGTYVVKLITYGKGCPRIYYDTIVSNCNLQLNIAPDTAKVCQGAPAIQLALNDTTPNGPAKYRWVAQNLASSQSTLLDTLNNNISFSTATPGAYVITGRAQDSLCARSDFAVVFVSRKPQVNFSGTPLSGHAPLQVNFSASGHNAADQLSWSFSNSTSPNPTHTFSTQGQYAIWLKSSNIDTIANITCFDSVYKPNYVLVSPPCSLQSNLLNTKQALVCTGSNAITFTANSSGAQGTARYRWTRLELPGQLNTLLDTLNNSLQFTTQTAGQWKLILQVSDTVCQRMDTATIIIRNTPSAAFSANPLFGTAPLNVQFNAATAGVNYLWSFGSSNASPTFNFSQVGHYHVWLKTSRIDTLGLICKDSVFKADYIWASAPCSLQTALSTASNLWECAAKNISFSSSTSGAQGALKYRWTAINQQNQQSTVLDTLNSSIVYANSNAGSWKVVLQVSDTVCMVSDTTLVHLRPLPSASFTANPLSGTAPLNVQFNAATAGVSYLWSFGGSGASPQYSFTQSGSYNVWLKTSRTDTLGLICSDSLYKANYINVSPTGMASIQAEQLKVYPNPTSGAFSVETDKTDDYSLTLMDVHGREVLREEFKQSRLLQINRKLWSNGLYLLLIKNSEGKTYQARICFE